MLLIYQVIILTQTGMNLPYVGLDEITFTAGINVMIKKIHMYNPLKPGGIMDLFNNGSGNGLLPVWHLATSWSSAVLLLIVPPKADFN